MSASATTLPLRRTLALVATGLLATLLIVDKGYELVIQQPARIEFAQQQAARRLLHQLQQTLNAHFSRGFVRTAEQALTIRGTDPSINALVAVDDNGIVLAATHFAWKYRQVEEVLGKVDSRLFDEVRSYHHSIVRTDNSGDSVLAYAPLTLATTPGELRPRHTGVLFLDYDLAGARQDAWREALAPENWFRWLMAVALSVGLIIFLLGRWIVHPLRHLGETADRLAKGEYGIQTRLGGQGEIPELASRFDAMSREIHDSRQALNRANSELEDKVRERTAHLQQEIIVREYAQQALRASKERIRLLMDSTAEAIYGLDDRGLCTMINRAGLNMLGYDKPEDVIGQNMHELIHHSHADETPYPEEQCPVFKAFRTETRVHNEDEVFWRRDGSSFPVEYWSYPIRIQNQTAGAVVTFLDVSQRKTTQELLAARLRLLDFAVEHDIHELLVATLDEACALTGSTIGFYHFVEADQKTLSLQAWSTRTTQSFCQAKGEDLHYDLDRAGVWANCIREGKPLIHNDYPSLTTRRGLPEGHAEVLREAVVPVFRKGLIVAILGVGNRPTLYTDKHVEWVSILADFAWDILERKRVEERLQQNEAQLRSILDTIDEGVGLWDADGLLRYVNPGAEQLFGTRIREVIPTRYGNAEWNYVHEDGSEVAIDEFPVARVLTDGEAQVGVVMAVTNPDGVLRWISTNAHPLFAKDNKTVTGAVTSSTDITALREHEMRLERLARFDSLTQLPNRLLFADRLKQLIAQIQRTNHLLAVCYLDLDGFKPINDTLGHEAGDELLIEVASRLQSSVRCGDTVARIGGDEFAVLLSSIKDELECETALNRLLVAIAEPYTIGGAVQTDVSASIGVTIFPTDQADPDTLLRHADHAMYAAKQAGKNRYKIFNPAIERHARARHDMSRRIEKALAQGQLMLYYQPKVNCRLGKVVGAEALIRWLHPSRGLIQPTNFLPLIEDADIALIIGEWVLRETLRQMNVWLRQDILLPVSVNVFARQLQGENFTSTLAAILDDHPEIPAQHLELEIVETAALKDVNAINTLVGECKAFGVGFALDDFGTGYSSLVHLRRIPAQVLKIDQSFVRDILIDTEDRALVEGVLGLGRAFGRQVVAEGVENADLIRELIAMGCDLMQGYGLARPMPAQALPGWIHNFRPDPVWYDGLTHNHEG